MDMYKVYYGALGFQGDAPLYEFETKDEVREFVKNISVYNDDGKKIYLVSMHDEVFVTKSTPLVDDLFNPHINELFPFYEGGDVIIHEYFSYEEAYKKALKIRQSEWQK